MLRRVFCCANFLSSQFLQLTFITMKTHPLIRRLRLARPAFLAASAALLLPSVARAGGGPTVRITADGSTAVFSTGTTAFVFTNDSSLKGVSLSATTPSITSLGAFTGNFIYPYVLSDNGSVVAGNVDTGTGSNAFRAVGGTITNLGTLGTGTYSYANYLSADGSVVVGQSYTSTASNAYHAFRWTTTSSTMTDLGTLGTGTYSRATAMTPDGSVIVGYSDTATNSAYRAFRWTGGTMTDLGVLGTGTYSYAQFVSTDGSVVVGQSATVGSNNEHAFRWTGGIMTDLGVLGTGTYSQAEAMTPDGSVVVGYSTTGSGMIERLVAPGGGGAAAIDTSVTHPFRWSGGTMSDLGTLGGTNASAQLVSADGSVVVGYSAAASNTVTHSFRWTSAGGMVSMNTRTDALAASSSFPYAMNSTGTVVVGAVRAGRFRELTAPGSGGPSEISALTGAAFRWTQAAGLQTVEEWLTAAGVTVAPTFHTGAATGVSEDGAVIVGQTSDNQPFIARGSGLVTLAQLQEAMATAGSTLNFGADAGWTILNGAHGHPLSRRAEPGHWTAWVAGDLGRDDHGARDGELTVGEVGVGRNFGTVQANLALGKSLGTQHTPVSGKTDLDGTYLITDLIAHVPNSQVYVTLLGVYQSSDLDVRRGYLNAGTPDASLSAFEAKSYGGSLRADWENAATIAGTGLSPYVKFTAVWTNTPTFTETGGGFPATVSALHASTTEALVGVNTSTELTHGWRLVTTLEAAHRFQERSPTTTADFGPGIGSVTTTGQAFEQDFLRASVGVEVPAGKGVFTLTINGTTTAPAASLWIATSYQVHF